jgi:hypothetical protein
VKPADAKARLAAVMKPKPKGPILRLVPKK